MSGYRKIAVCLTIFAVLACSKSSVETPPEGNACPDPTPMTITVGIPGYIPFRQPADNPVTVEGVALGRRLFYDPILSADSTVSCSSCHVQSSAFGDPRPKSIGVYGDSTPRQAPTIVNAFWLTEGLFWDGRVASIEDQATQPVQHPKEMDLPWDQAIGRLAKHDTYPDMFCAAFGDKSITMDRTVMAIAQFERTFVSLNSKYDRQKRGEYTFTKAEARGRAYFLSESFGDCFHCHDEVTLGNGTFANIGLDPPGTGDPGREVVTNNLRDYGSFKVPTLRNIMLSAPYMHDGRFATIQDVLNHYNQGFHDGPDVAAVIRLHLQRPPLTQAVMDTMITFFHTLTDTSFVHNPALSSPFED